MDVTVKNVIQTLSESSIVVPEVININIENETSKNEIDDIIRELSTSNGIKIIKPEYELNTSELNNILKDIESNIPLGIRHEQIIQPEKNNLVQMESLVISKIDQKEVFNKISHSALLFQIKDGNIKYIEKRGKELRNQSVIDLIQCTHKKNPLPNKTFIVYTNNFNLNIIGPSHKLPEFAEDDSLLSIFGSSENSKLFPSYVFNYFKKNNNIYGFENIYKNLLENINQWNQRKEQIYISESKINSVINNLYKSLVIGLKKNNRSFVSPTTFGKSSGSTYEQALLGPSVSGNKNFAFNEDFEKIQQYKYIISVNTSENSYLLPFYLLSGSCVILMKNNNKLLYLEEFFYKEYIAGEDYIEINYDNNESGESMIEKINNAIKSHKCEEIAKRCLEKSKKIFNIDNIYSYIHQQISSLPDSNQEAYKMEYSMFYTYNFGNYFLKDRLIVNNNTIKFSYQGSDLELRLLNNSVVKNKMKEENKKDIGAQESLLVCESTGLTEGCRSDEGANDSNFVIIKVLNNKTILYFNGKIFFNKSTPHLLLNNKYQQYEIIIENNMLKLVVENKFTLINVEIPEKDFTFSDIEIKSESDGSWII
jgi:hypothetical protein